MVMKESRSPVNWKSAVKEVYVNIAIRMYAASPFQPTNKTPRTIPTRVKYDIFNILSDADSTYHSNLVSCQSSRVINFVDVDPGGDSLIPVLTILTLCNSEL